MSTFSRGFSSLLHQHSLCLPSSIRVAIFSTRSQTPTSNCRAHFSTQTFFRQYAKPTGYPTVPKRTLTPPSGSFLSSDPVLRAVGVSGAPILLYRSPPRQLYMLGVYALACSTVAGGLYLWRWRYDLPKDLPFFVGPTYTVCSLMLLGIGAYIFSAPVSRCISIEIVPSVLGRPPQMRIKAQQVPFFMRERVILTNIGEPLISEKTLPVVRELQEAERARRQNISEGLEDIFIATRFWILVERFFSQKWTSFFLRFKFTILRFGNVKIDVQGQKWKIDCSGYLLEDGKAIDRLLSVE
ncbi:uncharacterized protein BDR25DRAFT_321928 [Lindgomyces ingoldianus]|uniref:Uncharacterized protein n=1 Tax=Lindgomyces ingoldianus TaxID=673940 RepID=A0ACB6RBQ6_9PLEO|nr:uncharacterized protein BDR25DRAFT_321928 [Lindgomyces ingoldianus]KAF2476475.1 hypothetical protein BDR25DRAFT_321928 [Lindgomyces ingoldianus]